MPRKFSTLLLIGTVAVIGLQVISVNLLPGQPARKQDILNRTEPGNKVVPPENPAAQSPGPDLPVPLTPVEDQQLQQIVPEHRAGKIPATPADPYSYAINWEQELATIKGINDPVVVIWQKNLYLAYHNNDVPDNQVQTEVIRRVKLLEPRFDKIFISHKQSVRQTLFQVQQKMKAGKSAADYARQIETEFKDNYYQ